MLPRITSRAPAPRYGAPSVSSKANLRNRLQKATQHLPRAMPSPATAPTPSIPKPVLYKLENSVSALISACEAMIVASLRPKNILPSKQTDTKSSLQTPTTSSVQAGMAPLAARIQAPDLPTLQLPALQTETSLQTHSQPQNPATIHHPTTEAAAPVSAGSLYAEKLEGKKPGEPEITTALPIAPTKQEEEKTTQDLTKENPSEKTSPGAARLVPSDVKTNAAPLPMSITEKEVPPPETIEDTTLSKPVPQQQFSKTLTIAGKKYKIEVNLPENTTPEEKNLFIEAFKTEVLHQIVTEKDFKATGAFTVSFPDEGGFIATDKTTSEKIYECTADKEILGSSKQTISYLKNILSTSSSKEQITVYWEELKTLMSQLSTFVQKGIKNVGNNCWINAASQALISSKNFRRWMESEEYTPPPELKNFYLEYQSKDEVNSQPLRCMLREGHGSIHPTQQTQEDSNELLTYILSLYPEELQGSIKQTTQYTAPSGELKTTYSSPERSNHIALALPQNTGKIKLEDMLTQHFQETHKDKEKYMIEEEIRYIATETKRTYETAPPELWIQIKRFTHDRNSGQSTKVSKDIEVSKELTVPLADGSQQTYILKAHINHINHRGKSLNEGHYVAYTYDANNEVHLCDDDDPITTVQGEGIQNARRQAYLLHYELKAEEKALTLSQ